jgi:hypothetical protein
MKWKIKIFKLLQCHEVRPVRPAGWEIQAVGALSISVSVARPYVWVKNSSHIPPSSVSVRPRLVGAAASVSSQSESVGGAAARLRRSVSQVNPSQSAGWWVSHDIQVGPGRPSVSRQHCGPGAAVSDSSQSESVGGRSITFETFLDNVAFTLERVQNLGQINFKVMFILGTSTKLDNTTCESWW